MFIMIIKLQLKRFTVKLTWQPKLEKSCEKFAKKMNIKGNQLNSDQNVNNQVNCWFNQLKSRNESSLIFMEVIQLWDEPVDIKQNVTVWQ